MRSAQSVCQLAGRAEVLAEAGLTAHGLDDRRMVTGAGYHRAVPADVVDDAMAVEVPMQGRLRRASRRAEGSCRRASCVRPLGKSASARSWAACERGLARAYSARVERAVLMAGYTLPRGLRACSVPAMDLDLVGRRAAVMASSDGIGKAIACALAREGVHVMMSGRDEDKLAGAAGGGAGRSPATARRSPTQQIDLGTAGRAGRARRGRRSPSSAASTSSSRTRAGRPPGPLLGFDDEAWQRAFESVLLSVARGARAALPHLEASDAGTHRLDRLLLDQGDAARRSASPTSSGPGIHGLVKTLAEELGPKGITVNLIAPGKIDTARVRWLDDTRAERSGSTPAEVRAASERDVPLRPLRRADRAGRGRGVPLLEGRPLRLGHGARWSTAASCARSERA